MITEDYISFETAKLLKEKGFREWCIKCYGVAVLHNGENISFDEECELKEEGRENEIEYVEGGELYNYGCGNRDKNAKVWAAPTLWVAMKWLRKVHNIDIDVTAQVGMLQVKRYVPCIKTYNPKFDEELGKNRLNQKSHSISKPLNGEILPVYEDFDTYEEACEAAIKYCLENLI